MTSEQNPANLQIQNFLKIAQAWPLNIDAYLKGPSSGLIFSLNSQIKGLSNLEKRNAPYLEEATSGESSPCLSDNEQEVRSRMPSLRDVSELLTEELSLEVDDALEKLRDLQKKGIILVFENFDPNFRPQKFFGYMKDVKVNGYNSNRILGVRDSKTIVFRGTLSILIEFSIQKHELVIDYLRKLETYLSEETRRRIKITRVVDDRKKRGQFYAVIIRNLPPRISGRDIMNQCQRDVSGNLQVGTILKIKDRYCCIIRFDNLEDAELVCRRLNNFQLKDSQTFEKYLLKAHLHPQCSLKHSFKRNSMFSEYFPQKEFPELTEVPLEHKTSIGELKNIFAKAKKPSQPEKPKPPPEIQKKEPANVERMESREPLETDELLRRMYSNQFPSNEEPPPPPPNGENAFAFMMQMSMSQDIFSKENILRGNERRDGYDERSGYYENGDRRSFRDKTTTPLSIVKDSSAKERRNSPEGSPSRFSKPSSNKYGKETDSRSHHHHHHQNRSYNNNYSKTHSSSQIERGLQIERKKGYRRSKSRSPRSKSPRDSRSRSRSRSKSERRKQAKKKSKKDKHRERSDSRKASKSRSRDRRRSKRSRSRSKSNSPARGKGRGSTERSRYKESDKRSRSRSRSKSSPKRKRVTEYHKRSHSKSRERSKNRNRSSHHHNHHHSQTDKSYNNKDYQDQVSNRRKQNEQKKYYSEHYHRDHPDSRENTRSNKTRDDSNYEDSRKRRKRSKSKNSRSRSRTRSKSSDLRKEKRRSKERKAYKSSKNGKSPSYDAPPGEKEDVPFTEN